MNLAALPSLRSAASHAAESAALRVQLVADIARSAFGRWAGYTIAALIVWTAFASVFSLLLGYSRVPYAAARDGNYFRFLAAVHPKHGIPHRSLVALGLVGAVFCFFTLTQVITMLVITRILLQFFLQQAGVILLRIRVPICLAPSACRSTRCRRLPPWRDLGFCSSTAPTPSWRLAVAAAIAASGTLLYLLRARRLRQWPFVRAQRLNVFRRWFWFVHRDGQPGYLGSSLKVESLVTCDARHCAAGARRSAPLQPQR